MACRKFQKITVFFIILSFSLSNFILFYEKAFALSEEGGGVIDGGGGIGSILSGACNLGGGGIVSGIFGFGIGSLGLSSGGSGAAVPSDDIKNNPKEQCLDKIAWLAAKYMIRKITDDLASWIRGGANGKPRFIQDFKGFLIDAADNTGGLLLEQILGKEDAQLLCKPWRFQIVYDLFEKTRRGKFSYKAQCKVSEIVENFEDFYDDFTKGGWGAFLTMALDDGSNPIGSYLMTLSEKEKRETFALNTSQFEATVNKGMLPGVCLQSYAGTVTTKNYCSKGVILTPGAAIEETLVDVFGTDLKQLELADEFNELIAATFDAIRMRRIWKDGIAGSDSPDDNGYIWNGWKDDADDWDPGTQGIVILSPRNQEIVSEPIKFDWQDVKMGGLIVKNYLIVITDPEGVKTTIATEETAEGQTPVSFYQQSQAEFNNMTLGGTYTWAVAALDKNNNIIGGEFGGFSAPNTFIIPAPGVKSPEDGQILNKTINLSWAEVRGATHYILEITGPENKTIELENTNYSVNSNDFNLWKGGEYKWIVTAYKGNKIIGRQSKELTFKILKKPALISPSGNITITLPYNFDWNDSPLATDYEFTAEPLSGISDFEKEINGASFTKIENLGKGGNYKWRVRANIKDENEVIIASSMWSDFENFVLDLKIPTADARASTDLGAGFSGASDILTFTEGPASVYLFGTGSDDSAVISYSWSCDSGLLTSASSVNALLTVPTSVNNDTTYICSLTVTDDTGNKSVPAIVKIIIEDAI